MKLITGHRRFTIEPENDVDRAFLLLIKENDPLISFAWDFFSEIKEGANVESICFYVDFETREDNK